ncbi:Neuropeptide FF receptor 2 [Branchiostoma belcheri]|nr:Neuropeptide FF receptor 2 [Branchiostoma belcheri]
MAIETSGNISNVSDDFNHTWNEEQFIYDKHKQSAAVIAVFALAYLSIFLLCVVGNVLVLLVVALNRNMRTVTNFFLANLAAADLLVGVFCLPFSLADSILMSWAFGDVMCKTFLTVQVLSVSASVFTLIAIAVDRYYAVVLPTATGVTMARMRYILLSVCVLAAATCVPQGLVLTSTTYPGVYTSDGQEVTACEEVWPGQPYRAGYVLGLFATSYLVTTVLCVSPGVYTSDGQEVTACEEVWPGQPHRAEYVLGLFATSYVLPLAIINRVYTSDGQEVTACEEVWPGQPYRAGYVLGLFATSYVLPLAVIAAMYVRISMRIWYRPKPGANQPSSSTLQGTEPVVTYNTQADAVTIHLPTPAQCQALQKKLHVIRMLLVVVVVFALSWLPLHVFTIVSLFADLTDDTIVVLYHYVFPVVQCMAFLNCGVNPIIYGYYNKNLRKGFYQLTTAS